MIYKNFITILKKKYEILKNRSINFVLFEKFDTLIERKYSDNYKVIPITYKDKRYENLCEYTIKFDYEGNLNPQ